jgi:hypothetical protein
MTNRGPLLTVVSIVTLALVLLGVNMSSEPVPEQNVAASSAEVAEEPAAAPAPPTAASTAGTPPAESPPAEGGDAAPADADGAFPAEAAYAGRTAGNEATLAIAVKDGKAVAYLCDGKSVEAWLEGTADGTKLDLKGAGGAAVTGTLTDGAVFGKAAAKGEQWAFSAAAAQAPAGAYRGAVSVAGVTKRIGWTVLQDGAVTGLVSSGGATSPAPALDPAARTSALDGVPVQVSVLTGTDDLTP